MMVPTWRLILVTGVLLVSVAISTVRTGWQQGMTALVIGVFLAVALVDLFKGKAALEKLTISTAPVFRMVCSRWSDVTFQIEKSIPRATALQIMPVFPDTVTPKHLILSAALGREQARADVNMACLAGIRGKYALDTCHVGMSSGLGLWVVRRSFAMDVEIRIYPNLISGQKQVLGLLHRREWGWRQMKKIGKGREFEQLREYQPGDSLEDIDWKATARRRYPISKDFEVEQSQEIYVVLDASRLSTRLVGSESPAGFPSHPMPPAGLSTIFEQFISGAMTMAMAAERALDRYGLLVFGAGPERFIKAGRGKNHYNACLETLYNYRAEPVAPDFEELFTYIGANIRKRSLLVFLTSLDDPLIAENFINIMPVTARRHVVVVNMMRPKGANPLFATPVSEENTAEGEHQIYEKLSGHIIWQGLSQTRKKLRQYGAGLMLLDRHQLSSQLIGQYREIKQRQII